jgi:hypothetical protein
VRLDDSSVAALSVIRNDGLSDSEAVRTALREAAARRRTRSSIAAEVRRLVADEGDREEIRIVREQMAILSAWDAQQGVLTQASCSPSMKPSRSSSAFSLRTATEMELVGLEPTTFWLPARRSPS